MKRHIKRGAVIVAALLFLLIGLAGFVLPLIPGFIFIAIALILASILSPSLREWIEHHTTKYPKFHGIVVKLDAAVRKVVGEV